MRSIGKIDTQTLLIAGGAAVAIYLFTRPANAVNPPTQTALQQQQLIAAQNPTASILNASGTVLQGLSSLIGNFF